MNFEDERYVRLFVRDTPSWVSMTWEARAVFPLLLRKVDRMGAIELGATGDEGIDRLAELLRMPVTVTRDGVRDLVKRGTVVTRGRDGSVTLIIPNFTAAQETPKTDAERAKEYRERKRAKKLSEPDSSDQFGTEQPKLPGVTRVTKVTRVTNAVTLNHPIPNQHRDDDLFHGVARLPRAREEQASGHLSSEAAPAESENHHQRSISAIADEKKS